MVSYNAADYIDKVTVLNACNQIDEYAKDYYDMARRVDEAADGLGKDVLSVEGNSLDVPLKEQTQYIRDYESQIHDLTDNIKARVNQAYDAKQEELNALKAADEAATRSAAEASSNS